MKLNDKILFNVTDNAKINLNLTDEYNFFLELFRKVKQFYFYLVFSIFSIFNASDVQAKKISEFHELGKTIFGTYRSATPIITIIIIVVLLLLCIC